MQIHTRLIISYKCISASIILSYRKIHRPQYQPWRRMKTHRHKHCAFLSGWPNYYWVWCPRTKEWIIERWILDVLLVGVRSSCQLLSSMWRRLITGVVLCLCIIFIDFIVFRCIYQTHAPYSSELFIQTARIMQQEHKVSFKLPMEGDICEHATAVLPILNPSGTNSNFGSIRFFVGDACNMPSIQQLGTFDAILCELILQISS